MSPRALLATRFPAVADWRPDPERGPVQQESVTALLRAAEAGDQDAWGGIVSRFGDLLWSVARAHRLSAADAGDVVQMTWLRLVENLGRIEDPERLAGWLATTARRECLRTLRRSGREQLSADGDATIDLQDHAEPLDSRLLSEERDAQLWESFGGLQPRCQQLLRVLMADPAPSYLEAAAALDMPIGSIGPTRARCLQRLRVLASSRGLSLSGLSATGPTGASA